ncbi:hypothetical protein SAMN04489735_104517 [Aneurinibacillus thermoaerophilus]|uniref:Uncharacterized protein n=1 Tax=Aneurinibacillus thermoaerophilus TaxID=143495 RepID=A0A1G8EKQ4_ANETH|nr:hypothetical protein [Aneurinibacillus thermoaerophilus]SDH70421.1 hypothetical protein SAMN04489735_104517 [Aneurinibacillus thermoaerophilus]
MSENKAVKREDLIGATGSITRQIEVIDAKEYHMGGVKSVDVRVREEDTGEEYWTSLEDVDLDQ